MSDDLCFTSYTVTASNTHGADGSPQFYDHLQSFLFPRKVSLSDYLSGSTLSIISSPEF